MIRSRRKAMLPSWILLATVAVGCLPLPNPGPAPTVGPPAPDKTASHAEKTSASPALQDTARRDPVVRPWPMVFGPVEATPIPHATRPAGRDLLQAASDSAAAAEPIPAMDSLVAAIDDSLRALPVPVLQPIPPEIAIDLPASARLRLERTALRDIALADSLTRRSALRTLPNNQRDKLETSLGLIEQAREALVRGDVPGAANLAFKARLIAEEVAGRR